MRAGGPQGKLPHATISQSVGAVSPGRPTPPAGAGAGGAKGPDAAGVRRAQIGPPLRRESPSYHRLREPAGQDPTERFLKRTRTEADEPLAGTRQAAGRGRSAAAGQGAVDKPMPQAERRALCAELRRRVEDARSEGAASRAVAEFCRDLRPDDLDKTLIRDLFHEICKLRGSGDSVYQIKISAPLAGLVEGLGGAGMDRARADVLVELLRGGTIEPGERAYVVKTIAQSTAQVGEHCPLHRAMEGRPYGGLCRPSFLGRMFSGDLRAARRDYDELFSKLNGLRRASVRGFSDLRVGGGALQPLGKHWTGLLQGEPKTAMQMRMETRKLIADLRKNQPPPGPRDIMQAAISQFSAGNSELAHTKEGRNRLAMTVEAMTAGLSDALGFDTVAAYAVQAASQLPGGDTGVTPPWLTASFAGLGSVSLQQPPAAKGGGDVVGKAQAGQEQSPSQFQQIVEKARRGQESVAASRLHQIEAAFTRGQSYRR